MEGKEGRRVPPLSLRCVDVTASHSVGLACCLWLCAVGVGGVVVGEEEGEKCRKEGSKGSLLLREGEHPIRSVMDRQNGRGQVRGERECLTHDTHLGAGAVSLELSVWTS